MTATRRSIINFPGRGASVFVKVKDEHKKKINQNAIKDKEKNKDSKDSKEPARKELGASLLNIGFTGSAVGSEHGTTLLGLTTDDPLAVDYEIFQKHKFPFENIVLEGGGIKGLAYVGALMVLEKANILQNIKRVCGASVGSVIAMLFACGYTPAEMKHVMFNSNISKNSTDHSCGYFSLIPNLRYKFGWNPAKSFLNWMKDLIEAKFGDRHVTFKELYEKTGKELCVVVTNLSRMSEYYCHVKTTPTMELATAIRMSVSFPGVFQSVFYQMPSGEVDVFADGGLLVNYPIFAFDGWWLSLKPEDSFFRRMGNLDSIPELLQRKNRFGEWNPKSLGMLLFSDDETEIMKSKFAGRKGVDLPKATKTKLYKKWKSSRTSIDQVKKEKDPIVKAFNTFLESGKFTKEDKSLIFGEGDLRDAFRQIDDNDDGELTFDEVTFFMESKGIDLQTRFHGYARQEIDTFGDYLSTVTDTVLLGLMRANVEDRDYERTIGINTGYIHTNDYDVEDNDKEYLFECGVNAAVAYLREHVARTPEKHFSTERLISLTEYQERHSKDEDDLIGHRLGEREVPDILFSSLETADRDKDDKNSHLCIESTLEEGEESEEILKTGGSNKVLKATEEFDGLREQKEVLSVENSWTLSVELNYKSRQENLDKP